MRPQQMTYAATDAYVCLAAYQELENIAEASSRQVNFAKWVEVLLKHKNKLPKGFKFQFKKEEDGYQVWSLTDCFCVLFVKKNH